MTLRTIAFCMLVLAGIAQASEPQSRLFVVHFATGPAWDTQLSATAQPGFKEHSGNLQRLRKAGQIRFGARYGELGMILLSSPSLEAATQVISEDPGVRAGLFTFTIEELNVFYPWRPEPH
ncbi:YciI family protein [Bowmanella dokdonensis]|uniref:YCII-related domain-containing protein n=1 Tax=Bowmanella dokdonensis TaxID=751969 RepID=A0A939IR10_9ALTE|nr:hypothetical protein [Bowmanella dokdonensis]MBN7825152.1 hypothetical protein [Bowmanella dokdonensis]